MARNVRAVKLLLSVKGKALNRIEFRWKRRIALFDVVAAKVEKSVDNSASRMSLWKNFPYKRDQHLKLTLKKEIRRKCRRNTSKKLAAVTDFLSLSKYFICSHRVHLISSRASCLWVCIYIFDRLSVKSCRWRGFRECYGSSRVWCGETHEAKRWTVHVVIIQIHAVNFKDSLIGKINSFDLYSLIAFCAYVFSHGAYLCKLF